MISRMDTLLAPTLDLSHKGLRIWRALMLNVTRGNLVLGATEPRLCKLAAVTRGTLVKAIAQLEAESALRWDHDLAVIRFNPHLTWDGRAMAGEEFENAVREWDGGERDKAAHMRAQLDYLFAPGGPGWKPGEEAAECLRGGVEAVEAGG